MYRTLIDPQTKKASDRGIVREADGAFIPADPLNHDWRDYQAWLQAGNTPTAGVAPADPVAASASSSSTA